MNDEHEGYGRMAQRAGDADDEGRVDPVPIGQRWADADRCIVVRSGPTMGRLTYPRTPLLDDEEPAPDTC